MKRKILTVLGARPQFIKASVVSRAISGSDRLEEVLLHTGQHFDQNMSDVFFEEMDIPSPNYHLGVNGGDHGAMTGRMLIEIERVLISEQPDAVLVYGDTNSTLAGAIAAAKLHIPIAHVEAGLRSFNMRMPEEVNRVLTDRISQWHFTPTETAASHLRREGVASESILLVGDVMFDAALYFGAKVQALGRGLTSVNARPGEYALVTIHRAENTNDRQRMGVIMDALTSMAQEFEVIWPVHPRTRAILKQMGLLEGLSESLTIIEPVGYLDMVQLEKQAGLIVTDSGGVQKEAFFYNVPCVTVREETEWVELVQAGWNRLAPPDSAARMLQAMRSAIGSRGESVQPYGDGTAASKIVESLERSLG